VVNALEGGRKGLVGQQDGGDHVETEGEVVGVREWVGTELEASERGVDSSFKGVS